MKSNFNQTPKGCGEWNKIGSKSLLALLAVAGMGLVILAGCNNHTPFDTAGFPGSTPTPNVTPVYEAPTLVPNRALVANFDNNSPVINPNLMEMSNPPNYVLVTPGSVSAVDNFSGAPVNMILNGVVQAGGANGTAYCFHVTGSFTDPGNSSYPAAELEAQMEGGSQYSGIFFSGVKFYLLIASGDNTTKRDFSIPVYQTQGSPAGGCNGSGCYDNFAFDLSSGTSGQWKAVSIPFSSLVQGYTGVITNPPTFSGANLQQMLWLQWEESRNNTAGSSNVDFSVDDIEFY
jgi:hypothetical protein